MNRRRRLVTVSAALAAVVVGVLAMTMALRNPIPSRDLGSLSQALANTRNHSGTAHTRVATDVKHQAVVREDQVEWFDQTGTPYDTALLPNEDAARLFGQYGFDNYRVDASQSGFQTFLQILMPLLFIAAIVLVFRQIQSAGGGHMRMGRSRAKLVAEDGVNVSFADVAGVDEAKQELEEIVKVLRDPGRFARIGAKIPKGVLLAGPPGTGKTLLARAVAGEAGVPFHQMSGSEFVEMFVGVGAARVRDVFAKAREHAPAIVFIDEIDAVGRRRGGGQGHSNDEREQTLNQLLVEMDGFDSGKPVIVMAATNRPDILDPALLRPGRFDRRVTVDNPDIEGRIAILEVHAKGKPLADDVDLRSIARQTTGMSGAELANVINEGALLAARNDREVITRDDLEEAGVRVMAGPERTRSPLSEQEREVIAHHEMGHALVSTILEHADPVHKISIVSRGRALGWTMILPERDRVLATRAQLTDQMAGLLGGRMAEELMWGADFITSGAADDIERATRLAYRMVTELGMSPLGHRAFLGAEPGSPRTYSESLAEEVDAEVDRLLAEATERARRVLGDRLDMLRALSARLLEVETMDAAEMGEIIERFPVLPAPVHSSAVRTRARAAVELVHREAAEHRQHHDRRDATPAPVMPQRIAVPQVRAARPRPTVVQRGAAAFLRWTGFARERQ